MVKRKGDFMIKESVKIDNETGLHARPATEISKIAMKYPCKVSLIVKEKEINAKSPLMIMAAGIKSKTELDIVCDGENEEEAIQELKTVFENQLGD